jgi:hypothetical protein
MRAAVPDISGTAARIQIKIRLPFKIFEIDVNKIIFQAFSVQ